MLVATSWLPGGSAFLRRVGKLLSPTPCLPRRGGFQSIAGKPTSDGVSDCGSRPPAFMCLARTYRC